VILDTARGMPGRFPPEFLARFDVPPKEFEPGRVTLPEAPAGAAPAPPHALLVRPQDIDPMGHVNNAAYLDYLEECLLAEGGEAAALTTTTPRRFRIEYAQAASPGATLAGTTWLAAPAADAAAPVRAWRLADAEGRELARALVTPDGA
jgi:acyl-ACP thioesterase